MRLRSARGNSPSTSGMVSHSPSSFWRMAWTVRCRVVLRPGSGVPFGKSRSTLLLAIATPSECRAVDQIARLRIEAAAVEISKHRSFVAVVQRRRPEIEVKAVLALR